MSRSVASKVAAFLEDSFGALCELALDLAIDREGKIYVLEVNPKPARSGDGSTYRKAMVRPLEYALKCITTKGFRHQQRQLRNNKRGA